MSLRKKVLLSLVRQAAPAVIEKIAQGPSRDLLAEERLRWMEEGARLSREGERPKKKTRRRRRRKR
jgi:hypothetical protein